MSYSFAIAADARADLAALTPWLQEEVLDELETLAGNPELLPTSAPGSDMTYVFSRVAGQTKHYIAVVLLRSDLTRSIQVLGISRQSRTLPGNQGG